MIERVKKLIARKLDEVNTEEELEDLCNRVCVGSFIKGVECKSEYCRDCWDIHMTREEEVGFKF